MWRCPETGVLSEEWADSGSMLTPFLGSQGPKTGYELSVQGGWPTGRWLQHEFCHWFRL